MATTAARRCSVCGRTGHDKRRHGARRNPTPGYVVQVQSAQFGGRWMPVARGDGGYSYASRAEAEARAATLTKRRKAPHRVKAMVDRHSPYEIYNPDFYRDRFGRPHPVRGTPGYEDAFVGMSRADKRYLKSGSDQPRGGYTQEADGRALRVTAEKRRSTAKRDVNAGERLARGRTAAQKQAEANRRYRVMGR